MKLTYHLFTPAVTVFEDALDPVKRNAGGLYEEVSRPTDDIDFEYKIYVESTRSKVPEWTQFLRPFVQSGALDEVKNTTGSFVVLLKIPLEDGFRFFALTGGQGVHLLNKDYIEEDFGLITALNSIDPEQIKRAAVATIEAKSSQRLISAKIGSGPAEFGLDLEHEILRGVSGVGNGMLGGTVQGATSLQVGGKVAFRQLAEQCQIFLERYASKDYREQFGSVNSVVVVKKRGLRDILTEQLVAALNARETSHLSVHYPFRFDDDRWERHSIGGIGPTVDCAIIDQDAIYSCLDNSNALTSEGLKSVVRIRATDGLDPEMGGRTVAQPLINFFVFETEYEGSQYVLSSRDWHRVSPYYRSMVEEGIAGLFADDIKATLRPWSMSDTSTSYAKHYGSDGEWAVLAGLMQGAKGREIYPELYHAPTRQFVFAKPLYRSATHSMMFNRGADFAEKLVMDEAFRARVNDEVVRQTGGKLPSRAEQFALVYGFGLRGDETLAELMPLFAKANAARHNRALTRLGYDMKIVQIPMMG